MLDLAKLAIRGLYGTGLLIVLLVLAYLVVYLPQKVAFSERG